MLSSLESASSVVTLLIYTVLYLLIIDVDAVCLLMTLVLTDAATKGFLYTVSKIVFVFTNFNLIYPCMMFDPFIGKIKVF